MNKLSKKNINSIQLTPAEIVSVLDNFVIGQQEAKRAVAIAYRNTWRRNQIDDKLPIKQEIMPKNILMVGPTGVGKTEIARRLAKITDAPFTHAIATKFTEVGYMGGDVLSIVRDLVDSAINLVRTKKRAEVEKIATTNTINRIINIVAGEESSPETRERFQNLLSEGKLNNKEIEIEVQDNSTSSSISSFDLPNNVGGIGIMNIGDMLSKAIGDRTKKRKMTVEDAYRTVLEEESDKLLDEDQIIKYAIELTENKGIIFIDEIDKLIGKSDSRGDVSREGVQRDLLPLIEGTTVNTKYGTVKTNHILFITAGAFHLSRPSDLLPELQGRLPIRVSLNALTQEDLIKILRDTEFSLLKQYATLLSVESLDVTFTIGAIKKIAEVAHTINQNVENIGARRLHTILEKLMEEISFAPEKQKTKKISIDTKYVEKVLSGLTRNIDLSKFIL